MVSKASDDLPEPLRPVMTTSLSRGISSVRFFRLCSRAPPSLIQSFAISICESLAHINLQAYGRPGRGAKHLAARGRRVLCPHFVRQFADFPFLKFFHLSRG